MNLSSVLRQRLSTRVLIATSDVFTVVAAVVLVGAVDLGALRTTADRMGSEPWRLALVMVAFGGAFLLRAVAWRRVLPGLSLGHSVAGVHAALGGNHLLPLRLGEPLRVLSVVRRASISAEAATASTVTLRAADLLAVV